MINFGFVIKKTDDWYIVNVDLDYVNSGVGVTTSDISPYLLNDVTTYCEANPDKVLTKHPLEERENLLNEKSSLEAWLREHDYIGTKIATGRATIEEYATEIEEMRAKANRINELEAQLGQ